MRIPCAEEYLCLLEAKDYAVIRKLCTGRTKLYAFGLYVHEPISHFEEVFANFDSSFSDLRYECEGSGRAENRMTVAYTMSGRHTSKLFGQSAVGRKFSVFGLDMLWWGKSGFLKIAHNPSLQQMHEDLERENTTP